MIGNEFDFEAGAASKLEHTGLKPLTANIKAALSSKFKSYAAALRPSEVTPVTFVDGMTSGTESTILARRSVERPSISDLTSPSMRNLSSIYK
jgi:hypothetical protein